MPTYERRHHLRKFGEELEQRKEAMDDARANSQSGGKGKRTTRISGEALKSKMKSGEIN